MLGFKRNPDVESSSLPSPKTTKEDVFGDEVGHQVRIYTV